MNHKHLCLFYQEQINSYMNRVPQFKVSQQYLFIDQKLQLTSSFNSSTNTTINFLISHKQQQLLFSSFLQDFDILHLEIVYPLLLLSFVVNSYFYFLVIFQLSYKNRFQLQVFLFLYQLIKPQSVFSLSILLSDFALY